MEGYIHDRITQNSQRKAISSFYFWSTKSIHHYFCLFSNSTWIKDGQKSGLTPPLPFTACQCSSCWLIMIYFFQWLGIGTSQLSWFTDFLPLSLFLSHSMYNTDYTTSFSLQALSNSVSLFLSTVIYYIKSKSVGENSEWLFS